MNKYVFYLIVSIVTACIFSSCRTNKQESAKSGKWVKYEKNPVLGGGELGTVFDICVLKDDSGLVLMR